MTSVESVENSTQTFKVLPPIKSENAIPKGAKFFTDTNRQIDGPATDWNERSEKYLGGWVVNRDYVAHLIRVGSMVGTNLNVCAVAGGGGFLETEISRYVGKVDVVDLSTGMLEKTKETFNNRSGGNGEKILVFRSDALGLPFRTGGEVNTSKGKELVGYDRTIIRSALHHMDDPALAVGEMMRVTKPGGLVILSDGTPPSTENSVVNDYARVFSYKESRRLIFDRDLGMALMAAGAGRIETHVFWMHGVSLKDWLDHSGLEIDVVNSILRAKIEQSDESNIAYGTNYVFVDGSIMSWRDVASQNIKLETMFENPDSEMAVSDIIERWRFVTVIGEK